MDRLIEIRNATLIRGRTRVFENLSLSVARGEHTAVLGPNGAGKSSLIRLLTLEDRPRAPDNGVPPQSDFILWLTCRPRAEWT